MVEDVVRSLGLLCLGTRLKRIAERLQSDTQRIAEAHGVELAIVQYPFLAALDLLGPSTVGDLAVAIGVTQPGATRTVGQLVDQGLVDVATPADDQRRRIVSLTEAGRQTVAKGKAEVWPAIEGAVRDLCGDIEQSLLTHLGEIEDRLADRPLWRRAALPIEGER